MALKFYWGSGSTNCWRVMLALEFKGIEYESKLLEFSKGEHKSPEVMALNFRGKLPAIKDGDFALYESVAIIKYLDEKYPGTRLFGNSPEESAHIMRVISEVIYYCDAPFGNLILPVFFEQVEEKKQQMEEAATALQSELQYFEKLIGNRSWLVGDAFSAADCVAYPEFKFLHRMQKNPVVNQLVPFENIASDFPNMHRWMQAVEALPGYEKAYPPHWKK